MWLKPFALGNAVWGRSLQILTRDIDNFAPPSLVAGMAALTNTPLEAAWRTSLAEFEGRLVERYTMAGRTNWIMPLRPCPTTIMGPLNALSSGYSTIIVVALLDFSDVGRNGAAT